MKILVGCPNWIGDVVMATPTFRALRRHFSEANITALMKPYVAETLGPNDFFDEQWTADSRSKNPEHCTWATIKRIRQHRFDLAILLTGSMRSALVTWLGGVKRRVGYAREGRSLLLNDALPVPRSRFRYIPSPIIDYYLRLAYHVGAPPESYDQQVFTDVVDEAKADSLSQEFGFSPEHQLVTLNPGAAFGPAKRWPSQSFSKLARLLVDSHPSIRVLVLCGPKERGFAQFITDGALRPRQVKSMADQSLSLGLTKALIKRSSLLVTTDSGPRHFGAAFSVPVVSLFGPTHIAWTETYYPKETKLQRDLPCGPCQQRNCPLTHHRCMKELSVEEVFRASVAWLDAHRGTDALPRVG